MRERHQGEDAALPAIVGAHDEGHVLDRDDDDQRPEEQRQAAVDIGSVDRNLVIPGEDFLHRIKRTGPDIPIDHPEGSQCQGSKAFTGDIAGLFMVGASTHPGAGVPGVLMSAKALEKVIPNVQQYA